MKYISAIYFLTQRLPAVCFLATGNLSIPFVLYYFTETL